MSFYPIHLFSHEPRHGMAPTEENSDSSRDKVAELGLSIWRTDPNHPFFHGKYEAACWDGTVYSQVCRCYAAGKKCESDSDIISTQWSLLDHEEESQPFSKQTLKEIDQLLDAPVNQVCTEYTDGKECEKDEEGISSQWKIFGDEEESRPFSMQTLIQEIDQLFDAPAK